MKPDGTFKSNRAIICGALGLACMFGGIWLGDSRVLDCMESANAVSVMRIFTMLIYALFFVVCFYFTKRNKARLVPFFGISALIGLICFAIGVFLLFGPPAVVTGGGAWCALFLTKVIGAPLSVGLVCVFALLGREYLIRMSLVGMLGAFLLYSGFDLCHSMGIISAWGSVLIAFTLMAVACLLGMLGMSASPEGRASAPQFSSPKRGVIKRPWRKVLTPGFVIMVIFSSMILGLLRSGSPMGDPHKDPVAIVVFIVFIVVSLLWKGLRIEHLFYAALLCTGAGFLLAPMFDFITTQVAPILYGIGMALFEVVTWALVVWAVRNCTETLMTAVAGRFAATFGHFLGTLIIVLGLSITGFSYQVVFRDGALFLMFIYVVLLVVLLKYPSLQAPFMTPTDATGYAESNSPSIEMENLTARQKSEDESSSMDSLDFRYWQQPCDTIAETYRLTAREREVLELLARGRNLAMMEEKLVISSNTLKMHIRHIYTKMDIHSKQDVINMVEQLRRDEKDSVA